MGIRQITITLSDEMADFVNRKVDSGDYASESEVMSAGLKVLEARDGGYDAWLRAEIVPAYEAHKANPEAGRPLDEVVAEILQD